ncbi:MULTISPECIES: ParB/RepB/Spo0J family partition protein [unclassified Colwellia]|jgi:ParB family chromosome partitioning protein|uniref:ParB/RepB/Spo0J family partition protein n=1 Tax=unclassified Colwellia TaxID=196834 RepID=UPI0015F6699A|nr:MULTISPECIES: ParB/RepB/Spo0J family partition protein [unclassified Colwellia]MBA6338273.1 ParB/RepB/Spo0J family partition protein [Colwellia sp. BRX8-7]MBA6347775.1 ParB/RepB/Spo0J family partition protein [Colwellia sp. BRX8-9]MBA6351768.1 ParB/RepB/Spo0J family partition protein [Colwellia sp. BRX9-1]MBA6357322.1 ParB/RepB/Spo0J family partition protein [Colwellia sp. BRX8-3]MBA6361120.1 ParB/RepB/Spo0J family partition protein [Colwellia sp. BRX8-6]|tara:strand:+ start:4406 stop:5290 length:885 start_codon:yes stop_codon:yes gene_type:complete
MSPAKRRGLGRGLDALLTSNKETDDATQRNLSSNQDSELQYLPIEQLQQGKYQPRKDMSAEALEDLSNSILSQGIIQPIVVRNISENNYEIIAGERRWRAAQLAKMDKVPCLIKNVPDEAAIAIALIENIQREDLNAMEEAIALERLLTEFELTHQEVANAVGKSRTTVSNLLRLNNLNEDVKTLLEHGDIEMGHARALLALEKDIQSNAARTVVAKDLTVRETEALIKKIQAPEKVIEEKEKDPDTKSLEQNLSERFGSQVTIAHNKKGKGKLVISYSDLSELDSIISRFNSY